jgi:hypothetical protein
MLLLVENNRVLHEKLLTATAALALLSGTAGAATLETYTNDYGIGKADPTGNDVLNTDSVTVSDQSTGRFQDSFDFSALVYDTIDSFELTLTFDNARPAFGSFLGFPFAIEQWDVRLLGSDSPGQSDDIFAGMADASSPQTFTVTSASGGDVFATAIANSTFSFGFAESAGFPNAFDLFSASLTINGTPAIIPLPAGLPLLLAGLGGLAFLRKRKAA